MIGFTPARRRNQRNQYVRVACLLALTTLVMACSWEPQVPPQSPGRVVVTPVPEARPLPHKTPPRADRGQRAADIALTMVGTPYQWGGATTAGFDCSGLIYYAYSKVDVPLPRTAAQQQRRARPVTLRNAQPGDLLFFEISGKTDHVGLYLGGHRFVHAPASGKTVQTAELNNPFYRRHLVGVGRIISAD